MNIRVRVKNSLQYYFTPVFFIDLVHLRRWKLIVCFYVFTDIFGEKKACSISLVIFCLITSGSNVNEVFQG